MSSMAVDEVLRPFPRHASAIWPGLVLSLCAHAAVLSTQIDLPGLLGQSGDSLPAARFEARLLAPVPPAETRAAVVRHPVQPRPHPRDKAPAVLARPAESEPTPSVVATPIEHAVPAQTPEPHIDLAPQVAHATTVSTANSDQLAAATAVVPARFDADYLHNPRPEYPRLARKRGQEGDVLLEVAVSADGRALETLVLTSSGHAVLDGAARRAVAGWRFVPARQGGQAVASTVRVPIRFRVIDAG